MAPQTVSRWTPSEVPPSGTDRSRFSLNFGPGGMPVEAGQAATLAYQALLQERMDERKPPPIFKTITLKRVVTTLDGFELIPYRDVTLPLTSEPRRPTKFGTSSARGGAALDELFTSGETFEKATDTACWEAVHRWAIDEQPSGTTLRRMNDLVSRILALRAGVELPIEF